MRLHFLPSETTYLKDIERAARKRTRLSWTCPKSAAIGETAFLLINGMGIVAAGIVDSATERIRTGRFAGRYEATISRVRMLPGVVPFTALYSRFPKWGYPTYPRSYATIESPLADQVREFIDLYQQRMAHTKLRRKQKRVQVTGQQLQEKSLGHAGQTMRWRQGRNPVPPDVQIVASPENSQLDYKVQTKTKIITAKKIEAGLLQSYQQWLAQQGRKISAIKYRKLQCDAYEADRRNLIEAKSSASREHVRMAVGQILDYAFQGKKKFGNSHKAILLPSEPHPDIVDWLDSLQIKVIWREKKAFLDNAYGQFT